MGTRTTDISGFYVVGINYKKTDAAIRSQFAISNEQYSHLLSLAPAHHLSELFVLSTCNRTEIYGFADNVRQLAGLLCSATTGDTSTFMEIAYSKRGAEAIEHLFLVSAGIDSQILGDYEIVGQIKQAVKFARENRFVGAFLDRLVNCVLQASKSVKNQTELSGGTVSVSFAAIQYIRSTFADLTGKHILLIGVGKIGRNTCRNMVDYLGMRDITLINRTEASAAELAAETGVGYASLDQLSTYVNKADIILVATNAEEPTLMASHLEGQGEKLVIDLSIPFNVEKSAALLPGVTLVNVDELSKIKDETLQRREAEVPKAKAIIVEHITEFMDWYAMRKHVPVLKAVKTKLKELHTSPLYGQLAGETMSATDDADQQIQRVLNGMATRMRQHNQGGCHYIQAINEYIGG
ncbi:glutamyl-tRNA reductase [Puia dinghuensis]|uniref:Glutamyl-tRNA reductase n=1 Tax=Puia dinghuensis TaxID=1792502 RepID=A0A8J2UGC8_9BACT|nr:glutamyl-tRNA reductase [Puia dinghuensis]GGB13639.1 glutamyl-tRNA reductase [Puia dinghuensis]